jgi:hypothetical protein
LFTKTNRSIVATSVGIIILTVGFDLTFFTLVSATITEIVVDAGWFIMVTGFSLVLYSRLYLMNAHPRLLKFVLLLMLVDSLIVYPIAFTSQALPSLKVGGAVYEISYKLEIIWTFQEVVISTLYIYLFRRFLRSGEYGRPHRAKRTYYLLCAAQVLILISDVVLTYTRYSNEILAKRTIQTFIYAVKIRFEFVVLNRLVYTGPILAIETARSTGEAQFPGEIQRSDAVQCSGAIENPDLENNICSSSQTVVEDASSEQRSSMEEIERRYLGRFRVDGLV